MELPALQSLDIAEYVGNAGKLLTSVLSQDGLQAFHTEMIPGFASTLTRKTANCTSLQEDFRENCKQALNQNIKLVTNDMHKQLQQHSQVLSTPIQELHSDITALRTDTKSQAFLASEAALLRVNIQDQSSYISRIITQAEEKKPTIPGEEWQREMEELYRRVEDKASLALQRAQHIQNLKARVDKLTNKETQITDDSWIALAPGSQKPSPLPTPEPKSSQPSPSTPYLREQSPPQYPSAKPFSNFTNPAPFPPSKPTKPSLPSSFLHVSDLTEDLPTLPKAPPPKAQIERHSPTLSPVESVQSSLAEFEDADIYLP
jgi:hypothetical protein